ncbi:MAG: hypothetical protein ACPGJV_00350 [Bacteriovoracaceae bacterium]
MKSLLRFIALIVCSFQLLFVQMIVPVASVAVISNVSYAEDSGTISGSEVKGQEQQQMDAQAESAVSDSMASADEEKILKGEDVESKGVFMQLLTMIIVGFVSAGLVMCFKMTPDIIIAALAGVAYIMGEVMALFSHKDGLKEQEVRYTENKYGAPELDESQIQALTEQKAAYEKVKKSAKTKKTLQMAASVGYGIAAAMALMFYALKSTAVATCLGTGTAAAPACIDAIPAASLLYNDEGIPQPSNLKYSKDASLLPSLTKCPACTGFSSLIITANAACVPGVAENGPLKQNSVEDYFNQLMLAKTEVDAAPLCKDETSFFESRHLAKVFEVALDALFPKAEANSFMTLLGGLGGGIGVFLVLKMTMGQALDTFMGGSLTRGIAFGVLSGTAFLTAKTQDDIIEAADKNIKAIDDLLNRYKNFQNQQKLADGLSNYGENRTSLAIRTPRRIGTKEEPFPCMVQDKNGKCSSSKKLLETSIGGVSEYDIPSGLTASGLNLASAIDSASNKSTLSDGALSTLEGLAGQSNAVKKMNDRLKKKINSIRKKNGQKPVAFNKMEKGFMGKMRSSLLKGLKSKGTTAKAALATLAPVSAIDKKDGAKDNDKDKLAEEGKESGKRESILNTSPTFRLDLGEDEGDDISMAQGDTGLQDDSMVIEDQDINHDTDANIFKIISVRYLKSGYPVIFEKSSKSAK